MDETQPVTRIPETVLDAFACAVFERLGAPAETAALATRSLLDASLMGVDSHGIEALDMYVDHIRAGGLDPRPEMRLLNASGGLSLWDMQHGFGLAGARRLANEAADRAASTGIHLAVCRRANHLGACGVYGKMAADRGLIAVVSQQTRAGFAPWGGTERRVGASPVAFAAPVEGEFPFCLDISLASVTGAFIKAHRRAGTPLPAGVALDERGDPTTDPAAAWRGQVLPIGGHKGVGLAMALEVLHAVLSGNVFSADIPSIVSNPEKSAGSSIFVLAVDPGFLMPREEFSRAMRRYAEYIESSPARDPGKSPRYPGRRAGREWRERHILGIPVRPDALQRLSAIARSLGLDPPAA